VGLRLGSARGLGAGCVVKRLKWYALLSGLVCLAGCQSLTKLSKFEVVQCDGAGSQRPSGEVCDIVAQTGCGAGQHCQWRGEHASCVAPGSLQPWSACSSADECPQGQTCDRGSCKPYCDCDTNCEDGGRCLPVADENGNPLAAIRTCWKTCEAGDDKTCAAGTSCRQAKTPYGDSGEFCVAAFDPCPTVEDGRCDEPQGTGSCAEGTDEKDCKCQPKLAGATCDPVGQCGCALSSTCVVHPRSSTGSDALPELTAECEAAGVGKVSDACESTADCQSGLFCEPELKLCTRYCSVEMGCEEGACQPSPNSDNASFGVCLIRCDRDSQRPCPVDSPIHAACATFNPAPAGSASQFGDYCVVPKTKDCPTDGQCDEPQGTRRCTAGTDTKDCCVPPDPRGACNPVLQCGCEPGTQCQNQTGSAVTSCQPEGTQAPESSCTKSVGQCPPGYHCYFTVCRKYCVDQSDCELGAPCFPDHESNAPRQNLDKYVLPGVGACMMNCDFANPKSCAEGMVCAHISAPDGQLTGQAYCLVPLDPCPLTNNGLCDDSRPGGTRVCALGTDPECGS